MIAEVQAKPGFDRFLRTSPASELAQAAADGPIIIVNASSLGSHALILTSGGVAEPLPLAGLSLETLYERVPGFLTAVDDTSSPLVSSRTAAEQRITETLGWLWDEVAAPVLHRLGITGPPGEGEPWPRLWWYASGVLSFLPLHAAGHHSTRFEAVPATVMDRVISSYTPTVRALSHARRASSPGSGDLAGAERTLGHGLAVAMPHTPGQRDLPGVHDEVADLEHCLPGQLNVLEGPQATRDKVLQALPAARWAHFACHAYSDPEDPSASQLLLADQPLTVADIANLRLDGARLAYLSACSTGRPGFRLSDEAIHLASAFQLAGYRQVVATLWPIGDQHAADIAAGIYTTLATAPDDAARAVHSAIRQFRSRWPNIPSAWASHIHTGV